MNFAKGKIQLITKINDNEFQYANFDKNFMQRSEGKLIAIDLPQRYAYTEALEIKRVKGGEIEAVIYNINGLVMMANPLKIKYSREGSVTGVEYLKGQEYGLEGGKFPEQLMKALKGRAESYAKNEKAVPFMRKYAEKILPLIEKAETFRIWDAKPYMMHALREKNKKYTNVDTFVIVSNGKKFYHNVIAGSHEGTYDYLFNEMNYDRLTTVFIPRDSKAVLNPDYRPKIKK